VEDWLRKYFPAEAMALLIVADSFTTALTVAMSKIELSGNLDVIPFKATTNAAYFHLFNGDIKKASKVWGWLDRTLPYFG